MTYGEFLFIVYICTPNTANTCTTIKNCFIELNSLSCNHKYQYAYLKAHNFKYRYHT